FLANSFDLNSTIGRRSKQVRSRPTTEQQKQPQIERRTIMVLLASTYDQSKYLRAEDVTQAKVLRIKKVTEELVGMGADQQKKLVAWFANGSKGLALNRTNNRTIRGAYGDDTAGWIGKSVVGFQTQAHFRGRLVPALGVRIPSPKQPSTPQEALNDFGSPVRPAPKPEPEPELVDDFNDEMPL